MDRDGHFLDALVVQRPRQVVMIGDVVPELRSEDHRDHVLAEEFFTLLGGGLPPALALDQHLAHADGDLGRTQVDNGDQRQHRLAHITHVNSTTR